MENTLLSINLNKMKAVSQKRAAFFLFAKNLNRTKAAVTLPHSFCSSSMRSLTSILCENSQPTREQFHFSPPLRQRRRGGKIAKLRELPLAESITEGESALHRKELCSTHTQGISPSSPQSGLRRTGQWKNFLLNECTLTASGTSIQNCCCL